MVKWVPWGQRTCRNTFKWTGDQHLMREKLKIEMSSFWFVTGCKLSRLMRLWHFLSSVNSFFKRAWAAIQLGLDVWYFVRPIVYCHTLCVQTAKALARLRGCVGSPGPSLVVYVVSTMISWAGSIKEAQPLDYAAFAWQMSYPRIELFNMEDWNNNSSQESAHLRTSRQWRYVLICLFCWFDSSILSTPRGDLKWFVKVIRPCWCVINRKITEEWFSHVPVRLVCTPPWPATGSICSLMDKSFLSEQLSSLKISDVTWHTSASHNLKYS